MATYTSKDFNDLVKNIKGKESIVKKATLNTIARSATFARNESVKSITNSVNLTDAYVKKHLFVAKRPSPSDLQAIVRGNERGTLLSRYPHTVKSGKEGGGTVSVKKGSAQTIKGLRYVKLRGSGETVIGVFNKDAVDIFTDALSKGKGATSLKVKKLALIKRRAEKKPYGRTPLHSSSVNQMFDEVRVDIEPRLKYFMRTNFLEDFNRLNKK